MFPLSCPDIKSQSLSDGGFEPLTIGSSCKNLSSPNALAIIGLWLELRGLILVIYASNSHGWYTERYSVFY